MPPVSVRSEKDKPAALQGLDPLENRFGVTRHLHLGPGFDNGAGRIDQESGTLDPHIALPIHRFFNPDAELLADVGLAIGAELAGKPVLGANLACFAAVSFEMPITAQLAA